MPKFVTPKLATKVNFIQLDGNEALLKNIVSQEGPVVVGIYASDLIMDYSTGIFHDPSCATEAPTCDYTNHDVVVVGELHFGSKQNGVNNHLLLQDMELMLLVMPIGWSGRFFS